jgi:hypothetical protein
LRTVLGAEQFRGLRLFCPIHLVDSWKFVVDESRQNRFSRTTEAKLTDCALIGDRNAVDLCHKRLIANSRKFPEDSLFCGCRTHYSRMLGEI